MLSSTTAAPSLDSLELFFGEATDAEARVYARLPSDAPLSGWQLTGTLTGPECCFARTLPASFAFHDLGPSSGSLLAEAMVTEPCFWTPDLPFLYRCSIDMRRVAGAGGAADAPEVRPLSERTGASFRSSPGHPILERLIGIRRLGAIGRSLYLDGKRWVARGVCRDHPDISDLPAARDASAVLRVPLPDDAFCLEASRIGVLLLVDLKADEAQLLPEIRRLGQWPAVFAIILDPSLPLGPDHRAAARNTLFAVTWPRFSETRNARSTGSVPATLGEACLRAPDWAQLAICPVEATETFAESVRDCPLPILAIRQSTANLSLPEARAACDRLQFDLAPLGDFAGFLV